MPKKVIQKKFCRLVNIICSVILAVNLIIVGSLNLALAQSGMATEAGTNSAGQPRNMESFNVKEYLTLDGSNNVNSDVKTATGEALQANRPVIANFIIRVINILTLTIGSFCLLLIVVGGFFLLASHGNENFVSKGKNIVKYAIIGLVFTLSAYFIVAAVQGLFFIK